MTQSPGSGREKSFRTGCGDPRLSGEDVPESHVYV